MMRAHFVAFVWALAASGAWAQEEASDGRLLFNNACRTCHSLRPHDNRMGPSLAGVVGRTAGALTGYGYSAAMRRAGLVWDEATLDRFLENADETLPGHKMKPYGGIPSKEARRAIIDYLAGSLR